MDTLVITLELCSSFYFSMTIGVGFLLIFTGFLTISSTAETILRSYKSRNPGSGDLNGLLSQSRTQRRPRSVGVSARISCFWSILGYRLCWYSGISSIYSSSVGNHWKKSDNDGWRFVLCHLYFMFSSPDPRASLYMCIYRWSRRWSRMDCSGPWTCS